MNLVNAIKHAEKLGYGVHFFSSTEDEELARYNVAEKAYINNAFTYSKLAHIIFINAKLSYHERLHALLHEIGHIELGHIGNGTLYAQNSDYIEMEAEVFAYSLLENKKERKLHIIVVAICITIVSLAGMFLLSHNNPGNEITDPVSTATPIPIEPLAETDFVYVTPSGEKFHRADCRYTKDKDCITLTRKEANEKYGPCSVCRP